VRRLGHQAGVSICHDDLPLFLYKIQLSQPLSEVGEATRRAFAREYGALPEDSPGALNVT
jgi:hypothetical protein